MAQKRARQETGQVADLVRHSADRKPAPAPLDEVQRLVNTRNRLNGYDLLDSLSTAREWLVETAPEPSAISPVNTGKLDKPGLNRLRDFREALRALLLTHATGETPDRNVVEGLRLLGTQAHLCVDFGQDGVPLLTTTSGSVADATGAVVNRVLVALVSAPPDHLRRLKACVNPDCGWAFYDTSRSRTGTWCVMGVCGARHKMAQYRSRTRHSR